MIPHLCEQHHQIALTDSIVLTESVLQIDKHEHTEAAESTGVTATALATLPHMNALLDTVTAVVVDVLSPSLSYDDVIAKENCCERDVHTLK